ncbi:type I restriction-modification system subunit M [Methylicorpusculum oleiharenae]|uniref:N-6 DNA methylase n=1 Tax=Methylicorpusculum oleiharenae TaxID=1338687 RepID=UPI00135C0B47|nr:N-6 DNA methylase [Methylicorpusculum oleiharenae]MCD2453819.1 type I restriction-modification system subunit M [Methylicorpusculum oleiharenae]
MNQQQIKQLETELWASADNLRANSKLTAAEYKDPVLGLILLRYAQNRYQQAKLSLEASLPETPRGKVKLTKEHFLAAGAMLVPEQSQYDYLANLPEGVGICEALNTAMRLIEEEYTDLAGILPKNYQELDPDLLRELIRIFNKDSVKSLTGDVFGRIYEYFLMKFSMSGAGAQEGGEFFTPPSLVQLIVNMIQPDHGIVQDNACGSGGMFVQTGHFIEEHGGKNVNETIKCYGTELKSNNAKLAKMNLAIHGIEGKIIESNSFYSDPHGLIGQCDFVMANPPFNVNKVDKDKDYVKNDPRLFKDVGIPKADNGNYLWIQYFYHYLNDKGRAGFVMASSATDAGNSEKAIRQKLIETGAVDCIVAVGNNFFYTRSLPCHVWFLDRGKREENRDKILMIDARNTFRKVTTTINDYSPGQLLTFTAIMNAYRGDLLAIDICTTQLQAHAIEQATSLVEAVNELRQQCAGSLFNNTALNFKAAQLELAHSVILAKDADYAACHALLKAFENPVPQLAALLENYKTQLDAAKKALDKKDSAGKKQLDEQGKLLRELSAAINAYQNQYGKSQVGEPIQDYKQALKDWQHVLHYFPDGHYADVEGLCKIVHLAEVAENDYSLTPGRYVGYSIQVDEDFDYQNRLSEIREELACLNTNANELMGLIQGISV